MPRSVAIQEDMERYIPEDFDFLPEQQQKLISQWCCRIPILGFNSGRYDLNLIEKNFVTHITHSGDVKVANKQNKVMFMFTPTFKFLDICNCVSPGTSNEKWVKTYGVKLSKSWLPYEWFDCTVKLDYDGLPLYHCSFSKLKNALVLSTEEYEDCQ